ncbi:MAG TPA: hypothetical protein VK986_17515 [Tepidisphaeraceae bacterium]|nr:hypothetical protein [Tepidisphaeraceae bacterium]
MPRRLFARLAVAAAVAATTLPTTLPLYAADPPAAAAADKPAQADVPVKVVVLFSSGVGYFEHGGSVTGNTSTELRFKTQQINDILKSLLLQDLGGGTVRSVVYPSQDPIEKTLRSFQIDITGNPGLAELLAQLRGAKVQVVTNAGEMLEGTILGVEKKPKSVGDKGQIEVWVVNLISGGTIRSVELGETKKLELSDKQLQEELAKALTALAQARDQDKKPVTIRFAGEGERQVRIGYVVETPVWKTSYRLVLPGLGAAPDGEKKEKPAAADGAKPQAAARPKLLGWAIVENQTDNDWGGVQLSLVSGRPISFIQDLYRPLYVPRPVVQPELYASLRPQTYDAGMRDAEKLEKAGAEFDDAAGAAAPAAKPRSGASADRLRRATDGKELANRGAFAGEALEESAKASEFKRMSDAAASVQSVASAAKVGELFQYTVGNVSLPRQQSAMIPIITDDVEIEKLSIYNPQVLARNPLYGARVKNTTGKHLLQGPITVIEGNAYAGDARIDNVPPGQDRLISYGVDLQVLVDGTKQKHDDTIQTGKIVKGVLELTRKLVHTHSYAAENKSADTDKTLVIEHPIRAGWKLASPEKYSEKTDAVYRFRQPLKAGGKASLDVVEELVQAQVLAILSSDVGTLEFYAKTDRIPKPVRDAIAKAIAMRGQMTDAQRQMDERRREVAEITAEQDRLRRNIQIIDRTSDYGTRLLKKLNDQETQIEKLQGEVESLQRSLNQQRKDFEAYLQGLNVE